MSPKTPFIKLAACFVTFGVVLSVWSPVFAQDKATDDVPYEAIVTATAGRFVFPFPTRPEWVWGGNDVYELSVRVENDGQQFVFGLFRTPPYTGRVHSGQPPLYGARGKVFNSIVGEAALTARPDLRVVSRAPRRPSPDDYSLIVVSVEDAKTLRALFYARPATAVFTIRYPDHELETTTVPITYRDYDPEVPARELAPTLEQRSEDGATIALSVTGKCAVRSTNNSLFVLDRSGREQWRWDFHRENRFISAGSLAVSPTCDVVAMVGNSGYKNTWIVHRDGRKAVIPTTSTPMGIAFDPRGADIAIGTGAGDVILVNPTGQVKWKTKLGGGYGIVSSLTFAEDGRSLVVGGWGVTGVIGIDGTVQWTTGDNGVHAARDLRSFVVWSEPGHGPNIGQISLLDANGRQLWSKEGSTPAMITPRGDLVVAKIYNLQQFDPSDFVDGNPPATMGVWSRAGELVRPLPLRGTLAAMSSDGKRVVANKGFELEGVDLDGHPLWSIPLDYVKQVVFSDDLRDALILERNFVRWYELPVGAIDSPTATGPTTPEMYRVGPATTDGIAIIGRVEIRSVNVIDDDITVITGPVGMGPLIITLIGDQEVVVVQEVVGPGTHHFKFLSKLPPGQYRHAIATWQGMPNELYSFVTVR